MFGDIETSAETDIGFSYRVCYQPRSKLHFVDLLEGIEATLVAM